MFGKSLNIGEFKIEYYSEIEANIIDKTIPIMNLPDNDSKMLSFSFPFLIITKLLYNFPPPSGMIALKEGYTNLDQKLDPDNFSKCNVSLLDNFSKKPIVFKKLNKKEKWIYKAEMNLKLGLPQFYLDIAQGNEDYLHKKTIDIVLSWYRERILKFFDESSDEFHNISVIICFWIKAFLKKLIEEGIEDIPHSFNIAIQANGQLLDKLFNN